MTAELADVAAAALAVVAGFLALVAGVGLMRFPDVFSRMHAATKPTTFGLILVAVALVLREPSLPVIALAGLTISFQVLSAPVGAHLIGRAAYFSGTELAPSTERDDLAGVDPPEPPVEEGRGDVDGNVEEDEIVDEDESDVGG